MSRINIALCGLLFCGFLNACAVVAQDENTTTVQDSEIAKLIGDWYGDSICVDKQKFPACNDESVVYHIKEVAGKPDTVNLSADKIVNGKPEFMGAFDFVYDPKKETLTGEFQNSRTH